MQNDSSPSQIRSPRFRVRILIKHPHMDPEIISSILELEPKYYWKAGEVKKTPKGTILSGTRKMTMCSYSHDVFGPDNFSKTITDLIDLLEKNCQELKNIVKTGGTIELLLDIPGDVYIGGCISHENLSRLSDIGVNLGFEVFPDFL